MVLLRDEYKLINDPLIRIYQRKAPMQSVDSNGEDDLKWSLTYWKSEAQKQNVNNFAKISSTANLSKSLEVEKNR